MRVYVFVNQMPFRNSHRQIPFPPQRKVPTWNVRVVFKIGTILSEIPFLVSGINEWGFVWIFLSQSICPIGSLNVFYFMQPRSPEQACRGACVITQHGKAMCSIQDQVLRHSHPFIPFL
jgi:hypothetical protein